MSTQRFLRFDADPETVARRLLGQRLVRIDNGTRLAGTIVEVEAYLGAKDKAAHTYKGHRSPRNESMYKEAGHAYVYFTYGMHYCCNVVCGRMNEGVAVLLRALEPTEGIELMQRRRTAARTPRALCSGPAKLTQAFAIDRDLDGEDLRTSDRMFIEQIVSRSLPAGRIARTARIGIGSAGAWTMKPLRFVIADSAYLSRPFADDRSRL